MARSCFLCKRRYEKASTRSYHLVPKDVETRLKWFKNLQLEPVAMEYIYLCSDIFCLMIYIQPNGRRTLKKKALPIRVLSEHSDTSEDTSEESDAIVSSSQNITQKHLDVESIEFSEILAKPLSNSSTSATLSAADENIMQSEIMGPPKKRMKLMRSEFLEPSTSKAILSSSTLSTKSESTESDQRKKKPLIKKKTFLRPRYLGDIDSDEIITPRKAKRNIHLAKHQLAEQRKRIRTLQQQNRRLKSKVNSLKSLLSHLQQSNLISENAKISIDASVPASNIEVIRNFLKGSAKQKYTPLLRAFALTLNFYSTKAYNYVRAKFNKSLPHPTTITRWLSSVDGAPGFTTESINALKIKVLEAQSNNSTVLCNLVMDEMSIRKHIEWTGKNFCGYVDIGTNAENDSEAKEVLVFMLVALNGSWKIPVAYFLLAGLRSTEKANLTNHCLQMVKDSGVIVTSFTFDGTPTNFEMAQILGANFEQEGNLKT